MLHIHSVTLSDDGAWLAVGIPGRSLVPLTQTVPLQFHSYTGAVRIYRRQDTTADISPTARYRYMGEITNPNSGTRFWDKFGSKVRWQAVRDVASDGRNVTRQMLFVVANAGWDGASTAFYDAQPDTSGWPAGETTDVSRAGVYVYELVKPTQVAGCVQSAPM